MTEEGWTTNEVQMIATEVVDRQSRYCAIKMENVEDKVDGLARQVARLADSIEEMRKADQKMSERLVILDQRWKLFTVVGAVVAFVLMVIELVRAFQGII